MIRIENLAKEYGALKALDGLSLETRSGEVLALLGPNGAGKSTTIKSIVGLVTPTRGRVLIDGIDVAREPRRARALIGYLPQRVHFYDNLTPREVLAFYAQLRKAPRTQIAPLIEHVGLGHAADRRTAGFSGGMLQRLGLAVALLGEPRLLVLDEPTAGLDPEGSLLFKETIQERRRSGTTVLLCSHLLAEVESVADRIAICNQGRIAAIDSLDAMRESLALPTRMVLRVAGGTDPAAIALRSGAREAELRGETLRLTIDYHRKAAVILALEERGVAVQDLRTEDPSLEDIFMAVVHRSTSSPEEVSIR
ncbi:MAG TPA: ABC transporter ATP-binding protein [Pantanalinema sp.]